MPDLQFTVPENISFPEAIALTEEILALDQPAPEVLTAAVTALVGTINGARGFFVTFLTGENALADAPTNPPINPIISALKTAPVAVADLMVKNLAMSTVMELVHTGNGDLEQAAGSRRVKTRSQALIPQLALPELQQNLQQLLDSTTGKGGQYQDFLDRQGYDDQQRQAIAAVIKPLMEPNLAF
jgi:hypothetical protein